MSQVQESRSGAYRPSKDHDLGPSGAVDEKGKCEDTDIFHVNDLRDCLGGRSGT